jgi:hypothetical protein
VSLENLYLSFICIANPAACSSVCRCSFGILAGRQLATLKLDDLLKQIPVQWEKQLETIAKG